MDGVEAEQARENVRDFIRVVFTPALAELRARYPISVLNDPLLKESDARWRRGDIDGIISLLTDFLTIIRSKIELEETLIAERMKVVDENLGSLFDHFPASAFECAGPRLVDIDELATTPGLAVALAISDSGAGASFLIEAISTLGCGEVFVLSKSQDLPLFESGWKAFACLLSRSEDFGIDLSTTNIHVDLSPIGGGDSAGLAAFLAMFSALTNQPMGLVAATGSVSLRGQIGPVGGVAEKVCTAFRDGIPRVLIPRKCESTLKSIPRAIREAMEIIPVGTVDEAIEATAAMRSIGEN